MSKRFVRWSLVVGCVLVVAGLGTDVIARSRYELRRAPLQKPQTTQVYSGLNTSSLMVKFTDDLGVYAQAGRLYHSDGRPVNEVNRLIDQGVAASAESEFEQDKATLLNWRRRGEARAQTPLADLTQYFRVHLAGDQDATAGARLCDLLNRSLSIDLAFLEGQPEVAGDIAPGTPDFEPQQLYLTAAPTGVDAYAAWGYPGGKGEGVTICDIEIGWHTDHEDLSKLLGNVIGGDPGPDNHGSAVMGEMLADSTISSLTGIGYGVTGISYGASGKMVSVSGRSTADALTLAAENLGVGDIILIELHQAGPNSTGSGQDGFVPMEWTPSIFDVIQTITANGIIVCEAAGNGGEDLDDAIYAGWFDTTLQHSGAIMCGAGAPPSGNYGLDRSRLDFSNHGARVDLQGYGREVVTTGYGGLYDPGDDRQWYTATFSGTSSASPIVTASVACIQGRFKNVSGGFTMTAREIRNLLYTTGSSQTGATSEHIGPRPDLGTAMPLVTGLSAYASPRTINVSLLDPPQRVDTLWLINPHGGTTTFDITIQDSLPVLPVMPKAPRITADNKELLRIDRGTYATSASNWISVSPLSGSIPAGDSSAVEVGFDGHLLSATYFGSIYKAQLDVALDGDLGPYTLPVPVLALAQDSLHGDTIQVTTSTITHRATSETNLAGWEYNDSTAPGWLYDGSFVVARRVNGDTLAYRDLFGNARMWRGRDFWTVDSSWLPRYLIWRDSSMTEDSAMGFAYEVWVPVSGDSAEFSYWRTTLYSRGATLPGIYLGVVGDWDLPASSSVNNLGGFDTTRQMVYQTGNFGFEDNAAGFALLNGRAHGGVVGSNPADVYPYGGFVDGRMYQQLMQSGWRVDASNTDLHTILSADSMALLLEGQPVSHQIVILSSRTGVIGLEEGYARAQHLSDTLRYLQCPIDVTGDVNADQVLTSADIIYLVGFVFKSGAAPLPIELAGDVDCNGNVTSTDIIFMVNHVFKGAQAPCDACLIY